MPHIHTEPGQHDATVSAYIIRTGDTKPALILHLHKKLDQWLQFGGHVELDEDPWQAMTHELIEESGYALNQLKVLQPSTRLTSVSDAILHPYPIANLTHQFGNTNHRHTDTAYAFVTHEPPKTAVGDGESTNIKAFTAAELATIPSGEIPENVREIGLFALGECLERWIEVDATSFSS